MGDDSFILFWLDQTNCVYFWILFILKEFEYIIIRFYESEWEDDGFEDQKFSLGKSIVEGERDSMKYLKCCYILEGMGNSVYQLRFRF